MSKFCIACGVQLDDDAAFCTICGTPQNAQPQQPQNAQPQAPLQGGFQQNAQPAFGQQNLNQQGGLNMNNFTQAAGNAAQQAGQAVKNTFDGVTFDSVKGAMSVEDIKNVGKTKNKNTIIGLAACGIVVLLLIIILAVALGQKPYEKPIKSLFTAIEKTDGKALENAFPDYMNEMAEDNMDDDKYDSLTEYYEEALLEDLHDSLEDEYGKNIKITYKIIKAKELKNSDLHDLEDRAEDYYDEKIDVSKGYKVKIKAKIKGKDDDETNTDWIDVYKIDGKWCIDGIGSSSLF